MGNSSETAGPVKFSSFWAFTLLFCLTVWYFVIAGFVRVLEFAKAASLNLVCSLN